MERLKLITKDNRTGAMNTIGAVEDELAYVQVDDNGKVIAVFEDETQLDISDLFSVNMIDDYKKHHILIRC